MTTPTGEVHISMMRLWPYLNHEMWRMVGALTEEAGEVQGVFNKMMDGFKKRTHDDMVTELVQLTANCFILAKKLGYTPEAVEVMVANFMEGKAIEIASGTPDKA